jgi:hypothetical protein
MYFLKNNLSRDPRYYPLLEKQHLFLCTRLDDFGHHLLLEHVDDNKNNIHRGCFYRSRLPPLSNIRLRNSTAYNSYWRLTTVSWRLRCGAGPRDAKIVNTQPFVVLLVDI